MFLPFRSVVAKTDRSTRHPPAAICSLFLLAVLISGNVVHTDAADDRVFTDSRGQVFTFTSDGDDVKQPKIVINAKGALSLFHLGMSKEQLVGVYDSWNTVELEAKSSDGTDSSMVLIPSSEERAFLESAAINLTPQCSTQTPIDDSCDRLRIKAAIQRRGLGKGGI